MNRAALIQNSESVRKLKAQSPKLMSAPSKSMISLKSKRSNNKTVIYQPNDELARKLIALRYGKEPLFIFREPKRPKKLNLENMKLN